MTAIKDLRITLVQADLVWEAKTQNLTHFEALLIDHNPDSDIIVLPEMFATGFSILARLETEDIVCGLLCLGTLRGRS